MQLTAGPSGAGKRDPSTPRAQPPTGITRARFGLIRFRSPLLTEYRFPAGTEMFHFPAYPRTRRYRPMTAGGFPIRKSSDQSPVGGSPRHIAASNVLHRSCLPRHPPYALAGNTHHTVRMACKDRFLANSQTTNHHTKMITKRSKQTLKIEFDSKSTARTRNQKETPSCSRPLSSSQATTHHHAVRTGPARHQARWASNRARPKPGVAIREPKSASAPLPRNIPRRTNRKPMISSTPAAPGRRDCRGVGGSHRRTNIRLHSP